MHKVACRKAAATTVVATQDAEIPEVFMNGMEVADSGGILGKVAIATRDFQPLDVVLLEPAAVVFGYENGYFGIFDSFLKAPSETQAGILEMMYPPIKTSSSLGDDPMEEERRQRDVLVEGELRRYQLQNPAAANKLMQGDTDRAKKLVRIVGNNAHIFYSTSTGDMIGNASSGLTDNDESALYVIGSKAEHSCAPNLRFCTDQGMLRYTAETVISRGDRLSISYASSVLQSSRIERRGFLLENKAFLCECSRCLGLDECSPLSCDQCQNGVIFQQGSDEKWCCVSECNGTVACPGSQQLVESEQIEDMDRMRDSLQHGIEESTVDAAMTAQLKVVQIRHPLHWLHVAAWDLVSIVTSSFARALMMKGYLPTMPKVSGLLRLSATCQLHQIIWTERNASIVYGHLKLKDAVAGIETNGIPRLEVDLSEDTEEVCTLLDLLTEPQHRPPHDCTEVLHTMFHAGQDLLLAGHPELAARLYSRYEGLFLSSPWAFSEKTRENFRTFIQSGGNDNHFENHLLAA